MTYSSVSSYAMAFVVRCMGLGPVGLGMGWVGSMKWTYGQLWDSPMKTESLRLSAGRKIKFSRKAETSTRGSDKKYSVADRSNFKPVSASALAVCIGH